MYWIQIVLYLLYTYLSLGLIFGLWFVVKTEEFKQLMPYWGKGMVMCK